MERIDHCNTVTRCLSGTDFKHSIKIPEAIRMAEVLLVKFQLRPSLMMSRFENDFQPHEGTVPELKIGIREHKEGAFSDLRLPSERRDKHAAIDEYADHPL